jgi:hypothetical protein
VIRDYVALMNAYGIDTIMSDNYGGGHYADEWRRQGKKWREAPKKSDVYIAFLALLEAKRALVLDNSRYRTQAAALERKVVGGNEIIDHPASSHDDVVNAVAGVLAYATRELRVTRKINMHPHPDLTKGANAFSVTDPRTSTPGGPSYRAQPPARYLQSGTPLWLKPIR